MTGLNYKKAAFASLAVSYGWVVKEPMEDRGDKG